MLGKGCLFGILGVLVALGLIGNVADVGARHYATSRIEAQIQTSVPGAHGVHGRIHSWPFLKVAVNGHVDEIGAHLDRVIVAPMVFSDVDVDVKGLRIDAQRLLSSGKLTVTHIAQGTIQLSVLDTDVSAALGVPVTIGSGQMTALGGAVRATLAVDTASRQLVIDVPRVRRFAFALPGVKLLPCLPAVALVPGRVTLSCQFDHIPDALTSVASSS